MSRLTSLMYLLTRFGKRLYSAIRFFEPYGPLP